jgi:hypothetical protein
MTIGGRERILTAIRYDRRLSYESNAPNAMPLESVIDGSITLQLQSFIAFKALSSIFKNESAISSGEVLIWLLRFHVAMYKPFLPSPDSK